MRFNERRKRKGGNTMKFDELIEMSTLAQSTQTIVVIQNYSTK